LSSAFIIQSILFGSFFNHSCLEHFFVIGHA
jgi:hypothetical protein